VTDVIMPDLDGIETIMALRQTVSRSSDHRRLGGGKAHAMQFLDACAQTRAPISLSPSFQTRRVDNGDHPIAGAHADRKSAS